jgi:hypothetical protein
MSRPRIRIRTLMVAVAAMAVLLGCALAIRRRGTDFRGRVHHHAGELQTIADEIVRFAIREAGDPDLVEWEHFWFDNGPEPVPKPPRPGDAEKWRAWEENREQRIAYHAAMYHKYERAARYPWLPISADPPPPDDWVNGHLVSSR